MNLSEKRQLKKINFELKCYKLDYDINQILHDLECSDNPKIIKKHFECVSFLLDTYKELVLSGIQLDISFDKEYMEALAGALFDKYCDLL